MNSTSNPTIIVAISLVMICLLSSFSLNAQTKYFVDDDRPDDTGNGLTWGTAFKSLQTALTASASGDTIWVAAGTYYPSAYPAGCASCTTNADKTFQLKNEVKIFGSFAGTEVVLPERNQATMNLNPSVLSGQSLNNYHVLVTVNCNNSTILNGFIVSNGKANAIDFLTISGYSNIFKRNRGAGMFNLNSSIKIENVVFQNNDAEDGGGLYNYESNINLQNSVITNNTSNSNGAGIYNIGSDPVISNCVIYNNLSQKNGGGFYNTFSSGTNGSNPLVTNCLVIENFAKTTGGGMRNFTYSSPEIKNSIVWGNTSTNGTAGIADDELNPILTYSDIQDAVFTGTGNLSTNPLFFNQSLPKGADGLWFTADDGLALLPCSPVMNAGTNAGISSTDILEKARPFNSGTADMGAYEFQGQVLTGGKIFVNYAATSGYNSGTTWEDAITGFQKALDVASGCPTIDSIWVAKGTYLPTESPDGVSSDNRDKAFHFDSDLKIFGGFISGDTQMEQRNWHENATILSGDFNGDDVVSGTADSLSITMNTENAYHVLTIADVSSAAVLDGFQIKGGSTGSSGNLSFSGRNFNRTQGGGINNQLSSIKLSNNLFYQNSSSTLGGGVFVFGSSSPTFSANTFHINKAGTDGGAVYINNANTTFKNSIFTGNAASNGGAFNAFAGINSLSNVSFNGNYASASGGALFLASGSANSLKNTIIWGNVAPSGNSLTSSDANLSISNSLIQGSGGSSAWTLLPGADDGFNIDIDPLFKNSSDVNGSDNLFMTKDDGLALLNGSPANNAGTSTGLSYSYDILGVDHLASPDMGAYENNPCYYFLEGRIYVDSSAITGANDGTTWANAFTNLQDAIDIATLCPDLDTIWVAKGTYLPLNSPDGISSEPRDKAFHLAADMVILGGFIGTETQSGQRNSSSNPTILSGDFSQNDVVSGSGETLNITGNAENAFHVLISTGLTSDAIIDGFHITGGNGNSSGTVDYESQTFFGDIAGGIYNHASSPQIIRCLFYGNNSTEEGGALYNRASSDPAILNGLFVNNSSNSGAAIFNYSSSPTLNGSTIAGNKAISDGAGISNNNSTTTILNSIIYGNKATANSNIKNVSSSTAFVAYSLLEGSGGSGSGWQSGIATDNGNNIDKDPLFSLSSDPNGFDNIFGTPDDGLTLSNCSPAANVGFNTYSTLSKDITNSQRIQNSTVDLGAYESVHAFLPSLSATLSSDVGSTFCLGTLVEITASAKDTITPVSYDFIFNNASVQNSSDSTFSTNQFENDDQIWAVITSNGCSVNSDTLTMSVNGLPAIPSLSSNSPICANANLTMSTTASATSYLWNGPNSFSSGSQSPSISGASISADGIYTLTVSDVNTCKRSNTIDLTVNPAPAAPTVSANPASGSGATSTVLTASGCSGTVKWSLGNIIGNPITATFNQTLGFSLFCTENGCVGPNTNSTFVVNTPCPSDVTLASTPDDYAAGFHFNAASQSNGTITASNKISGTAKVVYQSKALVFSPGFSAESSSGGTFLAQTGGCSAD